MNKGIVMEQSAKHVIVMTESGEFKKVARQGKTWQIGEEIHFPASERRSRPSLTYMAAAAAAILLFVAVFSVWSGLRPTPAIAAYITIDINPSIEMGIDADRNVVELRGLNPEGQAIVDTIEYSDKSLFTVTTEIINKADDYVESKSPKLERTVIVTSTWVAEEVSPDAQQKTEQQLTIELKQNIETTMVEKHKADQDKVVVKAWSTPRELREEAMKEGVSTGKLAVKLLAKNNAEEIISTQPESDGNEAVVSVGSADELLMNIEVLLEQSDEITKHDLKELLNQELQLTKAQEKEVKKAIKEVEKAVKEAEKAARKAEHAQEKADKKAEKELKKQDNRGRNDKEEPSEIMDDILDTLPLETVSVPANDLVDEMVPIDLGKGEQSSKKQGKEAEHRSEDSHVEAFQGKDKSKEKADDKLKEKGNERERGQHKGKETDKEKGKEKERNKEKEKGKEKEKRNNKDDRDNIKRSDTSAYNKDKAKGNDKHKGTEEHKEKEKDKKD